MTGIVIAAAVWTFAVLCGVSAVGWAFAVLHHESCLRKWISRVGAALAPAFHIVRQGRRGNDRHSRRQSADRDSLADLKARPVSCHLWES